MLVAISKGMQAVKLGFNSFLQFPPLPSNRHHWSNDDCLEGKRENYQICAVLYATIIVQRQSIMRTHMNRPNDCLLVRCSFSVVILCVTVYLC